MASQACIQRFPVLQRSYNVLCSSYLQCKPLVSCPGIITNRHPLGIPISFRKVFHVSRATAGNQNPPLSENERSRINTPGIGYKGEDPYKILESGKKVYLDELDVLSLLDQPTYSKPIDSETDDQAAYLWKKIADIPGERRHRLIDLLTSKQVESMWNIAGRQLGDSMTFQIDPANFLLELKSDVLLKPVSWSGRLHKAVWPLSLISKFQKHFFRSTDGSVYGRVTLDGDILRWIYPTYLGVKEVQKVLFTEEPCHMALDYGDGQLHLPEVPQGFPKPGKHFWPLSDASIDYARPVGPGVLVGQWWIEGIDPDQTPRKGAHFIMVKDYQTNKATLS